MVNNERILTDILEECQNVIDEILEESLYPDELKPFADSLKTPFLLDVDRDNNSTFGTFCIQVPEELIYAVGGKPVRLCMGVAESAELADNHLPKLACRLIRSLIGYTKLQAPYFNQIKNFVLPTTCDWKVKHFESMNPGSNICVMEFPHNKDSEISQQRWFTEIVQLKEWLEKQSGNKIKRKNLLDAVRMVQKAQEEYYRYNKFRRSGFIAGCEAFIVSNAYFYLHVSEWTLFLERLNRKIEKTVNSGHEKIADNRPRILLTGSPVIFPNFKLPKILEEAGCRIVVDELCSSERIFSDITSIDDKTKNGILKAISDRYLLPCTCPTFRDNGNRSKRLEELIDQNRIDGVVYYVLSGCHPYDIESFNIERLIKEKGIRFLKIETDYSNEDSGQLKTRVEAFVEMLKNCVH